MGFLSGSTTFQRFRVTVDPTESFGEFHLQKLRDNVIGSSEGNIYETPDVGFSGGAHLLDTDFALEKNLIGEALHFGVRIDSCTIPSPIKRAWMHQELSGMTSGDPGSKPTKAQRQEAKEAVEQRCADEADKGNFRKLNETSVLWDAVTDTIFLSSASEKTNDLILGLVEKAFGIEVAKLSCGGVATEIADEQGRNAELFGASPAIFNDQATGNVVWWNGMGDNYDWLGNEFLLWLWWQWDQESNVMKLEDGSELSGMFARSLNLDCPEGEHGKESISSDSPVSLPEAALAIRMGKLPRKAGLTLVRNGMKYDFNLQSELFSVGAAKISLVDESATVSHDPVDRIEDVREFANTLDMLLAAFCQRRLSSDWDAELGRMRDWLSADSATMRKRAA